MEKEYLKEEAEKQLYPYQIDSLNRTIRDYLMQNQEANQIVWKVCPKCGAECSSFLSGGYTQDKNGNHKKHMLKCPSCRKRFVEDRGQLTFYSHSDSSAWNKVIADTITGKPLATTAAEINRHTVTVFYMRHKFMSFIEADNDTRLLEDTAEADEKYVHECHKGLVKAKIDPSTKTITVKRRKKENSVRGLSKNKTCIITAVQRQGLSYIRTENMGEPSIENVKCLDSHISDGTFVFTDGCRAYEEMFRKKHCPTKVIKSNTSYDSVNHLNTVNSLHAKIGYWIQQTRNVSTVYINRYNALFSLRHKLAGEDVQEIVINTLRFLHKHVQYFFQRQQHTNIFRDPYALKCREGLISIGYINWLKSKYGYTVQNI